MNRFIIHLSTLICFLIMTITEASGGNTLRPRTEGTSNNLGFIRIDRNGDGYLSHTSIGEVRIFEESAQKRIWSLTLPQGEIDEDSIQLQSVRPLGGQSMQMSWRVGHDSTVVVQVDLGDGETLPRWSISIRGAITRYIERVTFPRVTFPRQESQSLIMPVGYGISKPLHNDTQAFTEYPSGSGTMQLLMISSPLCTIYLSTEDHGAEPKQFRCISHPTDVTLFVTTTPSEGWTHNDTLTLPWASVTGIHPKGWEETAREWYRPFALSTKWGEKSIEERDIPDWLRSNDLWIQKQESDSYTDLLSTMALYGNSSAIHWYHWHHYPFDKRYPDYFPEKPQIADQYKELSRMGAKVVPYINGRIWDPLSKAYTDYNGAEGCCTKKDGSYYSESYMAKVPHYVACPASTQWQDALHSVIHQISTDLDTSGVYVDQVGCAAPVPCYNPSHGHPLGGGRWWADGYRELFATAREKYLSEDQILATEECAECYIDIFDLMLIVNTDRRGDNIPIPLFPIVYSDRAIYMGFCYIGSPINNGSFRFITAKSLLWGSQLGWIQPGLIVPSEASNEAYFLKRMQQFRSRIRPLLTEGQMLSEWLPADVPVLDVPGHYASPVVLGARWQSKEGKIYLILVNWDKSAHKVTLPSGKYSDMPPMSGKITRI